MKNKKYFQIALYAFLTFAACFLFYTAVENGQKLADSFAFWAGLTSPFAIGFVLAYVVNFILKAFEGLYGKIKRLKSKGALRALSLVSAYLVFFIALVLVVLLIVPQLVTSISGVVARYDAEKLNSMLLSLSDTLHGWAGNNSFLLEQVDRLIPMLDGWMDSLLSALPQLIPGVVGFVSGLTSGVSNALVGLVISIYFLVDKERLCARVKKLTLAVLKKERGDKLIGFIREVNETVGDFLSGKLVECLIMGLIAFVAFWATGTDLPLLLAAVVGISNVVPFFGPIVGAVLGGVLIVLMAPGDLLVYVILSVVLQQLDGNVVGPKILGKSTGLDALWIVVAILLGGGLFGFWGMILGVPLFAIFYAMLRNAVNLRLKGMEMETATDSYVDYHGETVDLIENNSDRKKAGNKPSLWEKLKKLGKKK